MALASLDRSATGTGFTFGASGIETLAVGATRRVGATARTAPRMALM